MNRALHLAWHGRGLAHWPIVFPEPTIAVGVMLRARDGQCRDVTNAHVPVSLRPMLIGVELSANVDDVFRAKEGVSLVLSDTTTGVELAEVRLRASGAIPTRDSELHLFDIIGCRNRCSARSVRWLRYALAWRHAANAVRRGDRLQMSASDLRALNAYYIAPRPVYAVSVRYDDRTNVFPMDLVGTLPSGSFSLALRQSSPAVELIERAGRVAMSGFPSNMLADAYALGRHHRESTVNLRELPFQVSESPLFGLPIIANAPIVRELSVDSVRRIGSHAVFICSVAREVGESRGMIAHTSAMYVEWLRRRRRPVTVLS